LLKPLTVALQFLRKAKTVYFEFYSTFNQREKLSSNRHICSSELVVRWLWCSIL